MRYQVQDYVSPDVPNPFHSWTLDGAWDHKRPWRFLEEHGDIVRAFGDLWKTNKDAAFSVLGAIEYAQVNL
jgi:hypothetical protein